MVAIHDGFSRQAAHVGVMAALTRILRVYTIRQFEAHALSHKGCTDGDPLQPD
jgi:hypothetical protein